MICSSLAAEALPGLSFPALLALAMASRPTFPQVMVIPQLTTRVCPVRLIVDGDYALPHVLPREQGDRRDRTGLRRPSAARAAVHHRRSGSDAGGAGPAAGRGR